MGGNVEAYRWGISLQHKETSYAAQILDLSMNKWVEVNEPEFAKREKEFRTNRNRINGTRGATNFQLSKSMGSLSRKLSLSAEVFTWLLNLQLGNLSSSGAADPWTHTTKHPAICTLEPPSLSFIEGIACAGLTSTQKLFKGCVVNQQVITIGDTGEIDHTVNFLTDGSETTKGSYTFAAAVEALTYLLASQKTVKLNPFGDGDIDITPLVQSIKLTIDSKCERKKVSSNSPFAVGMRYGKGNPTLGIEMSVLADKSSVIYGYFDADTKLKFQLLLDPGVTPARTVNLAVAECFLESCEQGSDGIEPSLNLKFDLLDLVANSGPAIWTTKTGQATYLVNGSS